MQDSNSFKLSTEGLFYQLMERLGLYDKTYSRTRRRIAFCIGVTWLPLLILSSIEGHLVSDTHIGFLQDPVPYARYLIALPLLLMGGKLIDIYLGIMVNHLETSGVVPDKSLSRLTLERQRLERLRDTAWADGILLALIFAFVLALTLGPKSILLNTDKLVWEGVSSGEEIELTLAGYWSVYVASPFILFLIGRWVWRLIIWNMFCYFVSRNPLALQATHPDGVGGLGPIGQAQSSFGIILSCFTIMLSGAFATEILYQQHRLIEYQVEIVGVVILVLIVLFFPLIVFCFPLARAKMKALEGYGALGLMLSKSFQLRWLAGRPAHEKAKLIDTTDPSALADYSAVFENVKNMRIFPLNRQTMVWTVLIVSWPFISLILFQLSIEDLLQRLIQTVL